MNTANATDALLSVSSVSPSPGVNRELPEKFRNFLESQKVVVERHDQVVDYLERYPEIAVLLPEICAKLRQSFADAELALNVYTDPEIDDRYLCLYVRFERYAPGVIARIEPTAAQFDDALSTSTGYLLITTDFRRPRGNNGV